MKQFSSSAASALVIVVGILWRPDPATAQANRGSPQSRVQPQPLTDAGAQAAADQLLAVVLSATQRNSYYPVFARQKIDWISAQAKSGKFTVLLAADTTGTNVDGQALMASGSVGGKRAIVIVQPRFMRLLLGEGRVRPPFTPQQENNFMLGLVHEAVHLQNPNAGDPRKVTDRINEELRAWLEVSRNVVRPLRRLKQPMHGQFLQVDDAFRACGDVRDCPSVRSIIFAPADSR